VLCGCLSEELLADVDTDNRSRWSNGLRDPPGDDARAAPDIKHRLARQQQPRKTPMIGSQRTRIKKTLTPLRHRSPTLRDLSTHHEAIMAAVQQQPQKWREGDANWAAGQVSLSCAIAAR
jgi:hypothetical protein